LADSQFGAFFLSLSIVTSGRRLGELLYCKFEIWWKLVVSLNYEFGLQIAHCIKTSSQSIIQMNTWHSFYNKNRAAIANFEFGRKDRNEHRAACKLLFSNGIKILSSLRLIIFQLKHFQVILI
jgi:hypothetical protein